MHLLNSEKKIVALSLRVNTRLKPDFLVDELPITTTTAPFNTAFQVTIVFCNSIAFGRLKGHYVSRSIIY